jgi:hypothetical protein
VEEEAEGVVVHALLKPALVILESVGLVMMMGVVEKLAVLIIVAWDFIVIWGRG